MKGESAARSAATRIASVCERAAEATGDLAAAALLTLAFSIVAGITLRWFSVDNSWTYDLDLFSLIWVAFAGAVLTARRDHHVTAGIALENIMGGRGRLLTMVRFLIVGVFLALLAISGWSQAHDALVTHKTTLDIVQWPVWIAQIAVPVGAALWAVAELGKSLRKLFAAAE